MKYCYPLLILLVLAATPASGQIDDTLPFVYWESDYAEKLGIDLPEYSGNRFDANGDGISELVTAERNANGNVIRMHIADALQDSLLFTLDMVDLREKLLATGFNDSQISGLQFIAFLNWVPRTSKDDPVINPFVIANGGGLGVVFIDENGFNIGIPPLRYQALPDFDADGMEEVVGWNAEEKRVQVYSSRYANQ